MNGAHPVEQAQAAAWHDPVPNSLFSSPSVGQACSSWCAGSAREVSMRIRQMAISVVLAAGLAALTVVTTYSIRAMSAY